MWDSYLQSHKFELQFLNSHEVAAPDYAQSNVFMLLESKGEILFWEVLCSGEPILWSDLMETEAFILFKFAVRQNF